MPPPVPLDMPRRSHGAERKNLRFRGVRAGIGPPRHHLHNFGCEAPILNRYGTYTALLEHLHRMWDHWCWHPSHGLIIYTPRSSAKVHGKPANLASVLRGNLPDSYSYLALVRVHPTSSFRKTQLCAVCPERLRLHLARLRSGARSDRTRDHVFGEGDCRTVNERASARKEKDAAGVAHDLMLLLGSRKFCRSVIGASPRPARKPKKAAP